MFKRILYSIFRIVFGVFEAFITALAELIKFEPL